MRWAGALLAAVSLAGCGLGAGPRAEGDAELVVTRDYGARELVRAALADPPASETVLRALERHAKIKTEHGGGFVQAIEGIGGTRSSGLASGRFFDWFFYVNGTESPVGAAEARVHPGDAIWWDYREWTAAMRVPAVVGSWPEPFLHGADGKRFPTRIDCLGVEGPCREAAARLEREGVGASIATARARAGDELLRVVVGPWERVRTDRAAAQLAEGPGTSGVFARFEESGGRTRLTLLDARGRVRRRLERAGLIAAVQLGERAPTWVITGTDPEATTAAARTLGGAALRDRYAVAVVDGEAIPLPLGKGR